MSNLLGLVTKRIAIREARHSTKPTVPAEQIIAILKADLARVQAAIDALPHEERHSG